MVNCPHAIVWIIIPDLSSAGFISLGRFDDELAKPTKIQTKRADEVSQVKGMEIAAEDSVEYCLGCPSHSITLGAWWLYLAATLRHRHCILESRSRRSFHVNMESGESHLK